MQYKALALDMDGTLLDGVGELTENVILGIKQLQQAGIEVFLVSGRMYPSMLPFWKALELDTPIVSYNGGKIQLPGHEPIFKAELQPTLTHDIVEYCREKDYCLNTYFEDKLFTLSENKFATWYSEYFKIPVNILPEEEKWPGESPAKALIIVETEEELTPVYEEILGRFGENAHITTSSGCFVELLPLGVNKASAISVLADYHNIPLDQWVAVGDGMNDYEMLQECGVGLAVENGGKELLELIDNTVLTLPEGGLELIAEKFFGLQVDKYTI